MDRIETCHEAALGAWSEDGDRKVLDPIKARKALCLFWELVRSDWFRGDFDALRSFVFPEGTITDWLGAEGADQAFLERDRPRLSSKQKVLLECIVRCRVMDHSLAREDPLLRPGIEDSAQQPNCLSVELPVDSRFLPKGGSGPGLERLADFWVVPRSHDWPRIDRALQQGHFDRLVIRNHVVVPKSALGLTMDVKVPPADRYPAVFQSKDGIKVVATPHVHEGCRDWPLDGQRRPAGFNPDQGIVPEARADEILNAVDQHFRSGSNVIVMPELTLTAETARWAALRLNQSATASPADFPADARSRLCLIGSAHILASGTDPDPESGSDPVRRNRAFLLWGDGGEALLQDKLGGMTTSDFVEDISRPSSVQLMLTPFGLVCVLVCIDFCNAFRTDAVELASILDLGLVLTPSMGGAATEGAHKGALSHLNRVQGPAVVIAQQAHAEKEKIDGRLTDVEHFVAIRGEQAAGSEEPHEHERSRGRQSHFISRTILSR